MIATLLGRMRIFDAHTHFFSHSFYAELGKLAGIGGDAAAEVARRVGWDAAPDDPAEVARRWVAEMDRHGVDRMISIHTLPGDLDSAGRGVRAAGGRLVGYAMVNPLAAGATTAVEWAVGEFGFRGVA